MISLEEIAELSRHLDKPGMQARMDQVIADIAASMNQPPVMVELALRNIVKQMETSK